MERCLGRLLVLETLDADACALNLTAGSLTLSSCKLRRDALNSLLEEWGLYLKSGSITGLELEFDWSSLLKYWTTSTADGQFTSFQRHCCRVSSLELELGLAIDSPDQWHDAISICSEEFDSQSIFDSKALAGEILQDVLESEEGEIESVGMLKTFIDHLVGSMRAQIDRIIIRIGTFKLSIADLRLSEYVLTGDVMERKLLIGRSDACFGDDCILSLGPESSCSFPVRRIDFTDCELPPVAVGFGTLTANLTESHLRRMSDIVEEMFVSNRTSNRSGVDLTCPSASICIEGLRFDADMLEMAWFKERLKASSGRLDVYLDKDKVLSVVGPLRFEQNRLLIDGLVADISRAQLEELWRLLVRLKGCLVIPEISDETFEVVSGEGHLDFSAELAVGKLEGVVGGNSLKVDDFCFRKGSVRIGAIEWNAAEQSTIKLRSCSWDALSFTNVSDEPHTNFPFNPVTKFVEHRQVLEVSLERDSIRSHFSAAGSLNRITVKEMDADIWLDNVLSHIGGAKSEKSLLPAIEILVGNGTIKLHLSDAVAYAVDVASIGLLLKSDIIDVRAESVQLSRNERQCLASPANVIVTGSEQRLAVLASGFHLQMPYTDRAAVAEEVNAVASKLGSLGTRSEASLRVLHVTIRDCAAEVSFPFLQERHLAYIDGAKLLVDDQPWAVYIDGARVMLMGEVLMAAGVEQNALLSKLLKEGFEDLVRTGAVMCTMGAGVFKLRNSILAVILNASRVQKAIQIADTVSHHLSLEWLEKLQGKISCEPLVRLKTQEDEALLEALLLPEDMLMLPQVVWASSEAADSEPREEEALTEDCSVSSEMGSLSEGSESDAETVDGKVTFFAEDFEDALSDAIQDHNPADSEERGRLCEALIDRLNIRIVLGEEGDYIEGQASIVKLAVHLTEPSGWHMSCAIENGEVADSVRSSRWKRMLKRWPRGPDQCQRDFGTRSFLRFDLRSEQKALQHDTEQKLFLADCLPEYDLSISVCPLRLYLDQMTLKHVLDFAQSCQKPIRSETREGASLLPLNDLASFIRQAYTSPLALKIDYKPHEMVFSGDASLAWLDWCELSGAELVLPETHLRGIRGFSALGTRVLAAWIPHIRGSEVGNVLLGGLVPIRTVVHMGEGLAELILLPLQEFELKGLHGRRGKTKARAKGQQRLEQNTSLLIRGLRKGSRALVKKTGGEAVRLGASLAVKTQIVLEHVDRMFFSQSSTNSRNAGQAFHGERMQVSKYAEGPETLAEGLAGAMGSLRRIAKTIIAIPVQVARDSESEGSTVHAVLRAVPLAVLQPARDASFAIQQALMGVSAAIDPAGQADRLAKYQ